MSVKKATFSAFLRDDVVPDTRAQPGLIDCWSGESRTGDRDRQLRRLAPPASLALGRAHAATTLTCEAAADYSGSLPPRMHDTAGSGIIG